MTLGLLVVALLAVCTAAPSSAAAQPPLECTDAATQPNWPTFHVINAVTRDPESGLLSAEHLNDVSVRESTLMSLLLRWYACAAAHHCCHHPAAPTADATGCRMPLTVPCVAASQANAVFEYAGIYHLMNQGSSGPAANPVDSLNSTGVVNITHAVSNDLVHWFRVEDAIPRGIQGACDGTLSFPGGSVFGTKPVMLFGPDCADPDGFPHQQPAQVGSRVGTKDYPRVAVSFPAEPSDPHLIHWKKGPRNVSFSNGSAPSEPCSFAGKVWRSSVRTPQNRSDKLLPWKTIICRDSLGETVAILTKRAGVAGWRVLEHAVFSPLERQLGRVVVALHKH
jgi:hypothetical protein